MNDSSVRRLCESALYAGLITAFGSCFYYIIGFCVSAAQGGDTGQFFENCLAGSFFAFMLFWVFFWDVLGMFECLNEKRPDAAGKEGTVSQESQQQKFTGHLDWYAETGSEGVLWTFEKDGFAGWASLHVLGNGDQLTVFNEDGSVRWQGVIDLEYETGCQPPPRCQQAVFGMWVFGNQRGFAIEDWAEMFIGSDLVSTKSKQKLTGELIPAKAPQDQELGEE